MKRIVVTGGAGFIGTHLCRKLLGQGQEVICVDNFSTGSRQNIAEMESEAGFTLLEHDICLPLTVEADAIYNLACPASPEFYQRDPVQTMKTNVLGALNVLELGRSLNIPVLQASTSEVYGDPDQSPQKESYPGNVNPIGSRSCYDEGKRSAECLFFDYRRKYHLDIKVVRIFNTYGPGMLPHDGRVITNFIMQALRNKPVTVYGSGTQTRSFCYVDDMVDGLIRFMNMDSDYPGPVNLGRSEEISMLDLALLVKEMTGSSSEIIFKDLPEDDPRQRKPDLETAERIIDWNPLTELRTGLGKTIEFIKSVHFA